jgi:hypothetical protein
MSGDIFLNIDQVRLHGLEHINPNELEAALQQALMEKLASGPVSLTSATPQLRTGIRLREPVTAAELGHSLAQSLYGVISDTGAVETQRTNKPGGRRDA